MTGKALVVEWDEALAKSLRKYLVDLGWVADEEFEDMDRAYRKLRDGNYDVVVVGLDHRPQQALEFARMLSQHAKGRQMLSVFVDGGREWQAKVRQALPRRDGLKKHREGAYFSGWDQLGATLEALPADLGGAPAVSRRKLQKPRRAAALPRRNPKLKKSVPA